MGQFSYEIESQSAKTNRSRIYQITKFLFLVLFPLSVVWFFLLSRFIGQNLQIGDGVKKTKILIFDLEHFQFWHFKNSDPTIFGSIFHQFICLSVGGFICAYLE